MWRGRESSKVVKVSGRSKKGDSETMCRYFVTRLRLRETAGHKKPNIFRARTRTVDARRRRQESGQGSTTEVDGEVEEEAVE